MFLLCFLQQNIGQLSNLMLTNNKLQHSCDRVSRHLPTKPKSYWCDFLWSAVVFWESPFPTWFSSIFITSPFIVNPYKVIFTLPTWYVFGSLKRGKKYLQGEWIRKATKHQEPKNNHYLGAAGMAQFFFFFSFTNTKPFCSLHSYFRLLAPGSCCTYFLLRQIVHLCCNLQLSSQQLSDEYFSYEWCGQKTGV